MKIDELGMQEHQLEKEIAKLQEINVSEFNA